MDKTLDQRSKIAVVHPDEERLGRRDRMPSLRSLRTFEVVGRHLNMQSAAEILCITVSAVSHQIRYLEAELGVQLFRRTGRGLELTRDGEALLPGLSLVFDQLATSIKQFRRRTGPQIVTISMPASFAMRWFVGRLRKFYELYPDIDVRVATHIGRDISKESAVDCFIYVGDNDWPDLDGEELFSEQLSIACSPSILMRADQTLSTPRDVLKNRILRSDERSEDWQVWLSAMNLEIAAGHRHLSFQSQDLAIQAAIEGLGVILADPVEMAEELSSGRLVQPLGSGKSAITRGYHFYTMHEPGNLDAVGRIRDWLRSELSPNRSFSQ